MRTGLAHVLPPSSDRNDCTTKFSSMPVTKMVFPLERPARPAPHACDQRDKLRDLDRPFKLGVNPRRGRKEQSVRLPRPAAWLRDPL